MLSRRTVLKYTGAGWLMGLMPAIGATRRSISVGDTAFSIDPDAPDMFCHLPDEAVKYAELAASYWRSTDESLPKDEEVVLLATGGGASRADAAIWIATFVSRKQWTGSDNEWSFITLENQNDLYPGLLGDYKWMPLPSNPFRVSREWDHRLLADPLADHEQIGVGHYRVIK
jgi:hypothetical protein